MIASNMGGPMAVAGAGIPDAQGDQSVGAWKAFLESLKTDPVLRQGMLDFSQQVIQPNAGGTLGAFTSALANSTRTHSAEKERLEDRETAEEMRIREMGRQDTADARAAEAHTLNQKQGQIALTQAELQAKDMADIDRRLKEAQLAMTQAKAVNPTGAAPSWKEQLAAAKYSLGHASSMAEARLSVEEESRSANPQKMLGDFLTQNILFLQKKPELLEFFTETLAGAFADSSAPPAPSEQSAVPTEMVTDLAEVKRVSTEVLASMNLPPLSDAEVQSLMAKPELLAQMLATYEEISNGR